MLIIIGLILSSFFLSGCEAEKEGSDANSGLVNGLAMKEIDLAMASVAGVTATSGLAVSIRSGVLNEHCSAAGAAVISATDVVTTADEFAAGTGYCQATHNAQSSETFRGALYVGSAISCVAGYAGLFDSLALGTPNVVTKDITIDVTCFGNQAMVAAMVTTMGDSIMAAVPLSVDKLASGHAYDFKLIYTLPGGTQTTIFIKNSDSIKAASFDDGGNRWAVKMDATVVASTSIHYEGIDTTNYRRVRLLVKGTLGATGKFSSVASAAGFWMQGSSGSYTDFVTFTGDLVAGFIGNNYPNGGTDVLDKCHHPGGSGTCTGLTAIASAQADGVTQHTDLAATATTLTEATTLLTVPDTIDPTDSDLFN